MARMVQCRKLGKLAEGLERPTWPGELGQRIYEEISAEAWKDWLGQQTILINEYKLNPLDREHKKYLIGQMEAYLFGDGIELPSAWRARTETDQL
ncbi:MAG: oxidative damage protection protein [Gammaproteobacteria bacterium]|nr:oxidative damage protection protein [Gammaproteobacteria bacterium]MYD75956.1 oxidative damage protection protein [Gammaproteobacteria bacterium]MYJ51142.1 oxidative damage protection protein [Gammaproteobacteria bacterium]